MGKVIKWTPEELEFLRKNFLIMSQAEISEKLGRTKNAVQVKANKIGLKKPEKYFYNRNFFECINTEEKAYWLGFIYADGYICQSKDNNELGIELKKSDFEHLKKFNKSIEGNVEVTFRQRKQNININSEGICSIRLYSKKIVDDLVSQGVKFRKSSTIEFPLLNDKKLMIAFIRGFFDGDGCIMRNKNRECIAVNFTCSSINFIQNLREWLYSEIGISSYIVKEKRRENNIIVAKKDCYRLYIQGLENAYIFCSLLYNDATIYLDRKYNLFLNIVEEYNIINRIKIHHKTKRIQHANCLSK